jgi:predicted dehydrogenase
MPARTLKVGIIGANAARGWVRESHIPAIRHLDGLTLWAVANKGRHAAEAAAAAFGASKAYGDAAALIDDPEIDLVTVASTLPSHRELIMLALAAGKHVYSEYPLGVDAAESQALAGATRAAGVHTAAGLQARGNAAARRARDLIAAGAIGRPLSVRVFSSTYGFGPRTIPAEAYTKDPATGVNLVTIQGAHTLDLVFSLLGGFESLSALATTLHPIIRIGDGDPQRRRTFDHLLVQARLANGAAATIEVTGGRPEGDTPFRLEVTGEAGTLLLTGGAMRGFQAGRLALSINGVPDRTANEADGLPEGAGNVAGVYAALRDDIAAGTHHATSFAHAARLARVIEAALASSRDGRRVIADDWPES